MGLGCQAQWSFCTPFPGPPRREELASCNVRYKNIKGLVFLISNMRLSASGLAHREPYKSLNRTKPLPTACVLCPQAKEGLVQPYQSPIHHPEILNSVPFTSPSNPLEIFIIAEYFSSSLPLITSHHVIST